MGCSTQEEDESASTWRAGADPKITMLKCSLKHGFLPGKNLMVERSAESKVMIDAMDQDVVMRGMTKVAA